MGIDSYRLNKVKRAIEHVSSTLLALRNEVGNSLLPSEVAGSAVLNAAANNMNAAITGMRLQLSNLETVLHNLDRDVDYAQRNLRGPSSGITSWGPGKQSPGIMSFGKPKDLEKGGKK